LDSTNAEALRLAQGGERGPLWIDTEAQTLGRGRSGRHWVSEPGNLMTSFLFGPDAPMTALHQLSLVAGVAVFDAVAHEANDTDISLLRLKWPNDLMIAEAKAGGTLIESSTFGNETVAVIGIGLNVTTAPELDNVATTTLRSLLGQSLDISRLREGLAHALAQWLSVWSNGEGFAKVRTAWLVHGPQIGAPLTIKVSNEIHAGQFAGLDDHGALRLKAPSGEVQCYTFGDVSLPPGHRT